MSTTLTLNLPDDAIVSQFYDPATNIANYNLTIPKTDIPFLVRFLLNGIPPADKEQAPLANKEIIAKAAGLKYVYRLPSIIRTLMIGAACGIAIKTLSENVNSKAVLALVDSHANKTAAFAIKLPLTVCMRAVQSVHLYPYATALSLTGASLVTNLVSNETAQNVSYVLEGSLSLAKSSAKLIESGFVKSASLAKKYINFCKNNPKTGAAITASLPLGLAVWLKSADIENMYAEALKIGASAASTLMKNFKK